MVRQAYTLRPDDDAFSQPRAMVREVFNEAQLDKLVEQVAGSVSKTAERMAPRRSIARPKRTNRAVNS